MHRLLIPMLACLILLCTPALLRAQVPHEIQFKPFDLNHVPAPHQVADMPCNDAGTYTFGQFIGFSNDVAPSPIFLCFGDSLLVQHNGDADLSGSPNAATPAGIAYAFYTCPPTIDGPTLQSIGQIPGPGDPCVLTGSANGLFITQGVANGGGTWFFNSGALQTAFNMGQPLSLWFAPITVDNFANNTYEPGQPGFPPGPCVNVNTAAAFEVVYLNAITATGINNNFNNDCLGRFSIRGGYPQYAALQGSSAVFTISITLASDPSVKAIIYTGADQLFHQANVVFSVPQSGLYNVVVEDGKSCPFSFQIDMNVCNPSDNITLSFPNEVVPPGGLICVPITVENFEIVSGNFSIEWDETVLAFNSVTNLNPALDPFNATTLNTTTAANGQLGFLLFDDQAGGILNIADGGVLFEVCFNAIGQLGDCSGLTVTNSPTGVAWEDATGQSLALTVDTGQVCIAFLPLSFTALVTDTTCLGLANLNVTPAGGVEPYLVIVSQQPSGPNYNGVVLNPGETFTVTNVGSTNNTPITYNICVSDNNGIGATQCSNIVVNIPRLGAQINFAQQPLCNGQSNGVINAVVLDGGVVVPNPGPNYTFAWSPAGVPFPGQIVQNGVSAGLYTVTVTNTTTGCSEVASGTLGQPAPLSRELATNTPASCTGVCDGTITYEAEGGTPFPGPTYQYAWTYVTGNNAPAGTGFDNPVLLSNGCPGDYQIQITDANGCTFTDNLSLPALRSLSIATNNITNVSCNGGSNGSTTITVTESVVSGQTYSFFWLPTGFTQVNNSPSSMYSNLSAGDYIVLAVDALGCQTFDTVTISEPPLLTLQTLGQSNPGCAQPNSGSISVQAFGGTGFGTYTYTWSAPGGMGGQIGGLPFGTYSVVVTDGNGCTASSQFTLLMPMSPATSVDSISVRCGSDGSLTVNAPSGEVFVWIDNTGAVIDSSATITNLNGGTYIYRVFDAVGCLATDTLQFGAITPMFFSDTTLTPPTCFGLSNGQIAVGVQGGNLPYTQYSWSPTQPNSPVIFSLAANTYNLTVTDNEGCTLAGAFTLTQPPAIASVFSNTVNGQVSCFGVCDASATPIVAYATVPPTPGDFSFLWSNGTSDSLQVNVLCAGPNFVTITDANNCFTVDTVVITTPPQITATVSITNARCFGDSTGGATATASGGNGAPYTFLWNTGAVTSGITGVPAGNYTVTITDVNGCSNSINTVTIGQPAPLGLSTSTTALSCFGGNNGQATVEVLGGTGPFTFLWQNASGGNVGNAPVAEMLTAGTYVVFVTDANGCTSSTNATLQDPPPVVGDYDDLDPLTCFGDESILRILTIAGGSGGPYRFSVDFGAVLDPSFPVRIGGGKHYITYIDHKGCAVTDSFTLAEPAPITVVFDPGTIEVELGEYANLNPIITGASDFSSIVWTNTATLLNPDTINATAYTFINQSYTLTVTDPFGCTGSGTVLVVIDPNRNVYIPNAFKPANASGLNTHFNVNVGLGVELVNFMRVYDRWGNLMFQRERFIPNNDNLSEGWDGRFNGQYVNPGVFVYLVEVKFLDGRVLLYRGDVTVVR